MEARKLFVLFILPFLAACGSKETDSLNRGAQSPKVFALEDGAQVVGEVIEVNPQERTITFQPLDSKRESQIHSFYVSQGDAQIGYVGEKVSGRLARSADTWRLEDIWPYDPIRSKVEKALNDQLRRDTMVRGQKVFRGVGEKIPPFALYNQHGKLVRSEDLLGKKVVMNFIFTRCGVPYMCPAATSRMVRLQKEVEEAGLSDVLLVSVSFDPDYDTPGILRYYGEARGIDHDGYWFLTGAKGAIQDMLKQFGVEIKHEDGTINHTMSTLILDKTGKIVYSRPGSRWASADFIDHLKTLS